MLTISIFYDGVSKSLPSLHDALRDSEQHTGATIWIDLESPTAEELRSVGSEMHLHPLVISAFEKSGFRSPRYDFLGDQSLLEIQTYHRRGAITPADFAGFRVLLAPNFIATHHLQPINALKQALASCEAAGKVEQITPFWIASLILGAVAEGLIVATEDLEEQVGEIENALLANPNKLVVKDVLNMRRTGVKLRRLLVLQRDAIQQMASVSNPVLKDHDRVLIQDVLNRLTHAEGLSDSVILVNESALNSYLAVVNNRLNDVMKVLTVVGTVFLPLTFLTSLYGTNFVPLPGAHSRLGFWILVSIIGLLTILMVGYFYRLGWFRSEK